MKTVAILNAITPAEEAQIEISELQQFQDFFDLVENDFQVQEFRITEGEFPAETESFDAYLITGSPSGAYEYGEKGWIADLIAFIQRARAAQRTLVGICFGHQVLAQALGGQVEKAPLGWGVGVEAVQFTNLPDWMAVQLPSGSGHLYFCHQDQVVQLPDGAARLATSDHCPNTMYMIDDHVLGLQAHPEFTAETMHKVLDSLDETLDGAQLEQARQSTRHLVTKNPVVARWIVDFIQKSNLQKGPPHVN